MKISVERLCASTNCFMVIFTSVIVILSMEHIFMKTCNRILRASFGLLLLVVFGSSAHGQAGVARVSTSYVQSLDLSSQWVDLSVIVGPMTGFAVLKPPAPIPALGAIPPAFANVLGGLPFDFPYDDTIYKAGSLMRAGLQGEIWFGTSSGGPAVAPGVINGNPFTVPPPTPSTVGNPSWPGLICIFAGGGGWPLGTAGVSKGFGWSLATGTAPNRVLIIEWNNWYRQGATGSLPTDQMEVKLYETTGVIEFLYRNHNLNMGSTAAYYNAVGLNGMSTDSSFRTGYVITPSYASQAYQPDSAHPGYGLLQQYTPATDIRWSPAFPYDFSVDTITNPTNESYPSIYVPIVPTVQITNRGSQIPTSVTVRYQIKPYGGTAPIYTYDSVITTANMPTQITSQVIKFPPWTPTAYNSYEDTVTILNMQPTADQWSANNMATSEFIIGPGNNVRPLSFVDPLPNSYASAGTLTPIIIDFRNIGVNDQANVPLLALIKDQTGAVVYRDTEYAVTWPSGQVREVQFRNWSLEPGPYTFCAITLLPFDQQHSDDTLCERTYVRTDYDAAANEIVNPQPNEQKPYMLDWQPTALFHSEGTNDIFDVPVRVQIRRCSDDALVFQADSIVEALNSNENPRQFSFPSRQGPYNIGNILPGCYTMCAMALYPADADRLNDTICTQFSVIDRLKGDYFVGIGQQFPSIHAAVDSLRFRGIGAYVRLILTDNSYSENGTDSAASKFGALDFRDIRGLADTATVTWIPNTGITPRITFTGKQPFCFYFGDQFGGHMTFEGYNPVGAPIPDPLIAEPNKRGITIVNNSTAAGSVFAFEEGASTITLRDLVLKNNGLFSNDSDAVVRVYNEQNRLLYTGRTDVAPITDTVPIHNIRIENCELGNAKYGIWDHALHTQFNIGKSTFVDWRNYNNVFTRNTIGTQPSPLAYAGIQFNNEQNLVISHNEVSNVNGGLGGFPNVYGIEQPSVLQSDTGNTVGVWADANKVHNLTASGSAYGIAFQQAATIYVVGSGPSAVYSLLPSVTRNRATNNMIYDLRGSSANYPLMYTTSAPTYSTDKDSVFNNSISTRNAAINIFIAQTKHAFLWNNIIQNTGAGSYTNYSLQLPRPFQSTVSSDYNLFDLRGTNTFATVNEYDLNSGTLIQTRAFRRLNDWRTFTLADSHSVTGDPLFASDSLHEPTALSYVESPASNNGAWLNTATQLYDFDGDLRLQGNQTPDIGADEFDGFQYTSDLATLSITQPAGYSATSDTTSVTIENPLWVTAAVKNLSSQAVFNVPVSATVEVAISGGPWTTIYSSTTSPMNFEVNETKSVTFRGPVITSAQAQTGVFRVTVTTPNDQNNANNAAQKVFRVLLKNNATLVSYTSASPFGLKNRDSVTAALRRLNVAYDSLDRNAYGSQDVDYTPWWTLVWSSGDPTNPSNGLQTSYLGAGAVSFKETQDVERYLQAGQTYAKKSLIAAGQNIAFYNAFLKTNNAITDTEFMTTYLHTVYRANAPTSGAYSGTIQGQQTDYWKFPDNINSAFPDVVAPSFKTPTVGSEITGFAYAYLIHTATPSDSGAGVTYTNPKMNTVFYGFDWSDPVQTTPSELGSLTSGTTRVLKGALDFITSHSGTVLPVEFTNVTARRVNGNGLISWTKAHQSDIARFEVERTDGSGPGAEGRIVDDAGTLHAIGEVSAETYAFTDAGIDPTKTYAYRIAAIDLSGAKTYSPEAELGPDGTKAFTLDQNYPNPANGLTSIRFTLPVNAVVTLRIMDVTGKVVSTEIANESMQAGEQTYSLDASKFASGSYIYELTAVQPNGQAITLTKKMTLDK
jgi:hypothetical protein